MVNGDKRDKERESKGRLNRLAMLNLKFKFSFSRLA